MSVRAASVLLAILMPAAMLFASVAPAEAYGCPFFPLEQSVAAAELVVVGRVESKTGATYSLAIDRYLKGSGSMSISAREIGPPLGALRDWSPEKTVLLFLRQDSPGAQNAYWVMPCAGGVLRVGDEELGRWSLDAVKAITGPGQPPDDAEQADGEPDADAASDDLPREAMWAAAIVLPLLFLAAAVLWPWLRRR